MLQWQWDELAPGIFIFFKSVWDRKKTREESERAGGLGNKETEFASEIPTELPTVCCVFGTMNSIPSKTTEEEPSSSNAFLAFSHFLTQTLTRPNSTSLYSLRGRLSLPVLPNSLFNAYLYFLFFAQPLWIQPWPYSIFRVFHFAMNEAILQHCQMRFLSPTLLIKSTMSQVNETDIQSQTNKT